MSASGGLVVEAMARAKYERFDSHFSMPGGLSWEQYVAEDPEGAEALYRADARADLAAGLPLIVKPLRELAEPFAGQWHPDSDPRTFDQGVGAMAHDVLAILDSLPGTEALPGGEQAMPTFVVEKVKGEPTKIRALPSEPEPTVDRETTPPELVWECGPHANVWNGHDARCRQVRTHGTEA